MQANPAAFALPRKSSRRRLGRAFLVILPGGLALTACVTGKAPIAGSAPSYPTSVERAVAASEPAIVFQPGGGNAEQVWKLRSALNVAALACHSAGDRDIRPRYNQLLKHHVSLFAAAYASEQARYRQAYGARWQTVQDRDMTRTYNGYANPTSPAAFCAAANRISGQALAVEADSFAGFAAAALPQLGSQYSSNRTASAR
jgi:hypothetical protein